MKTNSHTLIRPAKCLSELKKLLNAYHEFLDDFETVFHRDADMSYDCFIDGETLDLESAIADPEQFDGDNWANRDNLLRSYGRLKRILGEEGISQLG
mgnify:FL=1